MAVRPIEYMRVAALLCERLPKGQDRTALLTVVFAGWLADRLSRPVYAPLLSIPT